MYQLISAIAKNIEDDTRWHNVDIGDMPFDSLYKTYSKVIATLSNNFLTHNVSLDLAVIRPRIGGLTSTLNDFLQANGDATLPTSDELPVIRTRYAKYADGFHAGYKVTPCAPGLSPDANLPASEKTDLVLTRKLNQTNYNMLYRHVLASVNGFIHAADASDAGFIIKDGMKSQMLSGSNLFGLMSFEDIGSLSFIPIKPDMIYRQNERQLLKNQCFIDSGADLSAKTVMLVLGGYLHVLDEEAFFRVSDSSFCVNFNHIPLIDRYFESRQYIDLSSMNVEVSTNNPNQIGIADILSDAAITAYCTLSQSFFVVLDNPDVFADRLTLDATSGPGMYTTTVTPVYPMIAGYGKLVNYWYQFEDGLYAISGYDTVLRRPIYDSFDKLNQQSISNSSNHEFKERNSLAYFLRIGTDI